MPAKAEQRLFGSAIKANTSGTVTGSTATATFAAVVGTRHFVQRIIISTSGTITPARATLTWTYAGNAQTVGIQVSATAGIWDIHFGNNPIEGDANTAVTLTIPTLGAGTAEAAVIGFSTKD